jgi:predicted nucleotidyltransferase
MNPLLEQNRPAIEVLCRRYEVARLAVFGSALRDDFDAESDVDFLVEFSSPSVEAFDRYFGLKEDLEATLGRKVDLVVAGAIRNPVFREEVQGANLPLYAA